MCLLLHPVNIFQQTPVDDEEAKMPLYPHSILKKKKPSEVIGAPSVVKPSVNNNNNESVVIKSKIESDSVDNPSLPGTVVSYSNENFSFK